MDFVHKGLPSDQCVSIERGEQQINRYHGYPAGQDAIGNFDYQQVFGDLENDFVDLKIGDVAGQMSDEPTNKFINFGPIDESVDTVDSEYKLLSNGLTSGNSNLTNLTSNLTNLHSNGHPNGSLSNGSLSNGSLTNGSLSNGGLSNGLSNGSLNNGSLSNGSLTNGLTNGHSALFNGNAIGQFNGIKYEPNQQQFDQISQSYELAKIANEFKEKLNDVFTAIVFYGRAISLNPIEFRFYCNRSICLQQANRLSEALEDANSAISLNPNARKPLLRKAEIFAILNKYNDAENILNYCLKLETATDIADEVIQEEIQKLIKTVLTKCGISTAIIEQTNHCKSIEQAMDYAFGKQMEEKLNSQNFTPASNANANGNSHNEKSYASVIRSTKSNQLQYNRQTPSILNLKSLDSQETIDYLTDEELASISTPNRKLSINEELFNLQSPSLKKDVFSFGQFESGSLTNGKHLMPLNGQNYGLIESGSPSLASLCNGSSQQYTTSKQQPIDIPGMSNRKRNSISLCEPSLENGSFSVRSLNFDRFLSINDFDGGLSFRRFVNESESIYSKSLGANLSSSGRNYVAKQDANGLADVIDPKYKEAVERANRCTNLIGYKGLWLGMFLIFSQTRLISLICCSLIDLINPVNPV